MSRNEKSTVHWVDQVLANARAGACFCGRHDGVQYGPNPKGYGPTCVPCQREWERQHGGARWESNDCKMARLRAERARAEAEGRDVGEVVRAWNQGLPPFEHPAEVYTGFSDEWKAEYEAWIATEMEAVA